LNDNVYSVGADFQCAGAQIVRILAAEALNNSNGALANAATLQSQIEEQALTAMSDINLKKMSAADIACNLGVERLLPPPFPLVGAGQ